MTINFFLQSQDFGGAEQFAQDLIWAITQKGSQVNLYTSNVYLLKNLSHKKTVRLNKTPIYLDFAGNYRGLIKSLILAPFAILYYLYVFSKIKNSTDQQIIIYSGFSEKIVPGALSKIFKLPTYFIEYGPLVPLFNKLIGIPQKLYSLNKHAAKKIIVPSTNTYHALEKIFDRKTMVLIPCGTTTSNKLQKPQIKQNTISVISRLEKGKGQDLLIKAFPLIKKEIPTAQLQIIGKGNFYSELKRLTNHDRQIKFLKYVTDKQKIIADSKIIVCPSVWSLEGFGLTIIEAMALAKPIVAFDRAPGNELLTNKQTALLAKDGDYIDLAKKIVQLLQDEKLQKKLAANARKTFKQKYKIDKIAQQYLDLFKN